MAPHSSTLAWKIPWTEEPGGLVVHGVANSRTRLSDFPFTFHSHALEKEMATHSSVLAWRIPRTGEPSGLPSMGSHSWTRLKRLCSSSSSRYTDIFDCTKKSFFSRIHETHIKTDCRLDLKVNLNHLQKQHRPCSPIIM